TACAPSPSRHDALPICKATAALAGGVQAALGVPVIGNGLRDGRNYFDNGTNALITVGELDGAMAEAWLRGATNPITSYPKETVRSEEHTSEVQSPDQLV